MTEAFFDSEISLDNLVRACHNPEEKFKWDKDLEVAEPYELVNGKVLLWYQRNKSAMKMINNRDFLEKKIKFYH